MFEAMRALTDLTGRLDAVRHVSAKLLRYDRDGRADELVTVLLEVSKTFNAFESVLTRYLSLSFEEASRDRDKKELAVLQGSEPSAMVGEMRARSGKIGTIYHQTLAEWFAAAPIEREEKDALHAIFIDLADSDTNFIIPAVGELVGWLENQVDTTSELVSNGQFRKATERVISARREVAPIRRAMGRVIGEIRDLEIQFTA